MILTIMRGKVIKKFVTNDTEHIECYFSSDCTAFACDLPSNPSIKIGDDVTISITPSGQCDHHRKDGSLASVLGVCMLCQAWVP